MAGRPMRRRQLITGEPPAWEKRGAQYRPPRPYESTHGARTKSRFLPIAEEIKVRILQARPDLAEPQFAASVQAWAILEARCVLYRRHWEEYGEFDDDGQPHNWLKEWDRVETQAREARAKHGLDPRSETILQKGRADVAALSDTAFATFLDRGAALVRSAPDAAMAARPDAPLLLPARRVSSDIPDQDGRE